MIKAGELRHRVAIRQKTAGADTEGIITSAYNTVTNLWVKIVPTGGEIARRKYGIVDDDISLQMISRPNSNVKEQNVVIYADKTYEIKYVAVFIDRYESLLKPVKA